MQSRRQLHPFPLLIGDHHSMGSGTNNANDVLRPQPPLLLLQPSVIQDVAFFRSRNSSFRNFLNKKQIKAMKSSAGKTWNSVRDHLCIMPITVGGWVSTLTHPPSTIWTCIQYWRSFKLVEMSSSWNFPARASPSYEGSEPNRAKLGHINFRAETELMMIEAQNCNFVPLSSL